MIMVCADGFDKLTTSVFLRVLNAPGQALLEIFRGETDVLCNTA